MEPVSKLNLTRRACRGAFGTACWGVTVVNGAWAPLLTKCGCTRIAELLVVETAAVSLASPDGAAASRGMGFRSKYEDAPLTWEPAVVTEDGGDTLSG